MNCRRKTDNRLHPSAGAASPRNGVLKLPIAAVTALPALGLAMLLAGCAMLSVPHERVSDLATRRVPAEGILTVVTYNMLHGFGDRTNDRTLEARLALLARALAAADPDVIILQEASLTPQRKHGSVAERLRDLLNDGAPPGGAYGSSVAMAHGSRLISFFEGSAVLSRFTVESVETIAYRTQALLPPERRIALRVVLRGERGPFEVVGTHLTNVEERRHGTPVRELQARELVDRILRSGDPSRPLVVGGDFNAPPASAIVRGFLEAGALDAWDSARPGEDGYTALDGEVTDSTARPIERIDYLFVRGARVLEAAPFLDAPGAGPEGRPLWVSDHVGVLVRIAVP